MSSQKEYSHEYFQRFECIGNQFSLIHDGSGNGNYSLKIDSLIEAIDSLTCEHQVKFAPLPEVSIIIPVCAYFDQTINCLKSLYDVFDNTSSEIIIIDDVSREVTGEAFTRFKNLRYITNEMELGFFASCNYAARFASGYLIVFLSNDSVVFSGWLDSLVETFKEQSNAGLVCSKLVSPEGRLLSAGGEICKDGTPKIIGSDDDPHKPQYNYLRKVDFCPKVCFCALAHIWRDCNGFEKSNSYGYSSEIDLANRIQRAGHEVLYQSASQVIHKGGNVSVSMSTPKFYKKIVKPSKHIDIIGDNNYSHNENFQTDFSFRNRFKTAKTLVIDVFTPKPDKDSGSIDTYNYLITLRNIGFEVSFISVMDSHIIDKYVVDLQKRGIECVYSPYLKSVDNFIKRNAKNYDLIFLFRAPYGGKYVDKVRQYAPHTKIVFNVVDLHFLREEREREIKKAEEFIIQEGVTQEMEIALMRKVDQTILVSDYEKGLIARIDNTIRTMVIPIPRVIPGRQSGFSKRKDIVFIGGFSHKPNIDAVLYFAQEIWPYIHLKLLDCKFLIIGSNVPEEIDSLNGVKNIKVVGHVPELSQIFSSIKLSVAPLRYGAGIKGKVITSLSYGVPCVVTSIAAEGGGFTNQKDIIICDYPEEFANQVVDVYNCKAIWEKLSKNGLEFVTKKHSIQNFEKTIIRLVSDLGITNLNPLK